MKKVEFNNFKISLGKNPPSVQIENELMIADEFWKVKEVKSIDKTAIKEAIKSGQEVAGAILVQGLKLNIK